MPGWMQSIAPPVWKLKQTRGRFCCLSKYAKVKNRPPLAYERGDRTEMRVENHVVIDVKKAAEPVEISVDGRTIKAWEGEPILAALLANGIKISRYTVKRHEPRGLFCGIGQCTDCAMTVDGQPNVRTCITPVRAGMSVRTQD